MIMRLERLKTEHHRKWKDFLFSFHFPLYFYEPDMHVDFEREKFLYPCDELKFDVGVAMTWA